jgi:hypothetical protein
VGLPPHAIEKDIWVTTILQIVFTLPFADRLIFKGGTSLSKVWGTISRFSEDIDLAVDRSLFDIEGEITKKKIKKLRKASSVFVREDFKDALQQALDKYGLSKFCTLEAEADGEGDNTYPEPRKLFIKYKSVLGTQLGYLHPVVVLEVGSRSLFEPNEKSHIQSLTEKYFPMIQTTLVDAEVATAVPAKTFLEKAFLIHELFSVSNHGLQATRKSRHLYDLSMMMDHDFAKKAICDDELWESIRRHREIFTSVHSMDYTPDIRDRIQLIPREDIFEVWKADYNDMQEAMIYGQRPSWNELINRMIELQKRFRNHSNG